MKNILLVLMVLGLVSPALSKGVHKGGKKLSLHSFTMKDIDGGPKSLADYEGKVCLVVNVASKCGNTPQYKGLEALYEKYKARGFEVLGFPANDFGKQEPGDEKQIKEFCSSKYHVTFPMFAKIEVKGPAMHPLYKFLTTQTDYTGDIEWNFGKFLVGKDGRVLKRFSPDTQPDDPGLTAAVEKAL